jgi:hypothetical protein
MWYIPLDYAHAMIAWHEKNCFIFEFDPLIVECQ